MITLPQAGCPLTLLAAATQPPNQTESFTTSISSLTILVMEGSLGALFLPLLVMSLGSYLAMSYWSLLSRINP